MRKFLFLMMCCIGLVLTSCKTEMGLAYNVAVQGNGDGNVEVTFDQGKFAMAGTAAIVFYAQDSVPFIKSTVVSKKQVLESNKKDYIEALDLVQASMENITATSAGGNYDLNVEGYVTVYPLNISVEVHKHLSSKDNAPVRKALRDKAESAERWCYIE